MNISGYSFKNFQRSAVIRFLELDKYRYLLEKKNTCNMAKDKEYQRTFNKFFMIRRDEKWRTIFYDFFEKNKLNKEITFEEILRYMYKKTGNIEASFSSKMLAIINTNMPIWDQYVISNLGLIVEGNTKEERLASTIDVYNQIIKQEKELIKREDIQKAIKDFKKEFGKYGLSDVKILDYIIWNVR